MLLNLKMVPPAAYSALEAGFHGDIGFMSCWLDAVKVTAGGVEVFEEKGTLMFRLNALTPGRNLPTSWPFVDLRML
jgi:hypothetical protein